MEMPSIRDSVLRLLRTEDRKLHRLFHGKIGPEQTTAETRLQFWKAVVASDLDIRKVITYGNMRSAGMLSSDDGLAFIAECRKSDSPLRDRWRALVFQVFSIEDSAALESLSD